MSGGKSAWDYGWQSWESGEDWRGHGKGKKGSKKGKNKWPSQEDAVEATPEHTNRILSRYQLPHALLRTACDTEGSALIKKSKVNDYALLSERNLKKTVSNQNCHLLRRPGVGLSETAGTLQAGANALAHADDFSMKALTKLLNEPKVAEALRTLNTMDQAGTRDEKSLADAVKVLQTAVCDDPEVEEAAIKMTILASRLYLLGIHLLPLRTCFMDPTWWAEQIPESLSENKKFTAWKKSPGDPAKMRKALAALVQEKLEDATGSGANEAGALFGRKATAPRDAATSGDDDSDAKKSRKKQKAKKDTKEKSKKKKKSSSSSPSSSVPKKSKKRKGAESKEKETKSKKKAKAESSSRSPSNSPTAPKVKKTPTKSSESHTAAFTAWAHGDAQAALEHAEAAKGSIGTLTGRFKKADLLKIVNSLPEIVADEFPELAVAVAEAKARSKDGWISNKQAKPILVLVTEIVQEVCNFWAAQSGPSGEAGKKDPSAEAAEEEADDEADDKQSQNGKKSDDES
eukprot:Skav211734  [mRNA]  locus=scaffold1682:111102:112649:+ [translate_table: standard]